MQRRTGYPVRLFFCRHQKMLRCHIKVGVGGTAKALANGGQRLVVPVQSLALYGFTNRIPRYKE
jgi:hypothetical protein